MSEHVKMEIPIVAELRKQLVQMNEENTALRTQLAQRDRWIKELRDAVAALQGAPDAA